MVSRVHFSSEQTVWRTPPEVYVPLREEFGWFDLDAAADGDTALAPHHYDASDNGLEQPWFGLTWCNPPYARAEKACRPNCKKKRCAERGYHLDRDVPGGGDWIAKGAGEAQAGRAVVLMLLPVRPDTDAWGRYILDRERHCPRPGVEVRYLGGRVRFWLPGQAKRAPAPFPSAVVVFRPWLTDDSGRPYVGRPRRSKADE